MLTRRAETLNGKTKMKSITVTIDFMSAKWEVTGNYYPGTNYPIHSASPQPNDDPYLEIDDIICLDFDTTEEFRTEFLEAHEDEISQLAFDAARE